MGESDLRDKGGGTKTARKDARLPTRRTNKKGGEYNLENPVKGERDV